jgi:rubrerythrin
MAGLVRKMLFAMVLEDAIVREENAYRAYESALETVGGRREQRLLRKLCAEELRHRLKLAELQKRGVSEELEFSGRDEIELLDHDDHSVSEVNAQSSCSDILNLALSKEMQAVRYYQLIAGRSTLRVVRDLFLMLAGEEREHVRWVKEMLART